MESPSLEIFQTRLATVLCSLLWVTLLGQGVGLGDPQRALPTSNILGFCEPPPPQSQARREGLQEKQTLQQGRCGSGDGEPPTQPTAARGSNGPGRALDTDRLMGSPISQGTRLLEEQPCTLEPGSSHTTAPASCWGDGRNRASEDTDSEITESQNGQGWKGPLWVI